MEQTPSKLGLNERKALFEKQSGAAVGAALARVPFGVSATAAPGQERGAAKGAPLASAPLADASTAGGGSGSATTADAPALSLKERMALLQGGGTDGAGGEKKPAQTRNGAGREGASGYKADPPAAAPAPASVNVTKACSPADVAAGLGKLGGLQDRLKAFEGAAKPVAQQTAQPPEQPEEKKQSINQRMAALQGGAGSGAGDESNAPAGGGPVVGKLRSSGSFKPADASSTPAPAAGASAAPGASAAADTTMSLKERLALLQQQEKKEETKAVASQAPPADSNSNRGKSSVAETKAANRSGQENLPPAEPARPTSGNQAKAAVQSRWQPGNLSTQAREVAAALGGLAAEEEEEEEEPAAGELQVKSVFGRVSMFETGDMAAGWDVEEKQVGRLPGQPKKEEKVDQAPLDVNSIKNRWQSGGMQTEDKTKKSASEDALFRCHVAASSRTGGVAEIQNRMKALAEGKQPSPPAKQPTKVQELAEQIHFDPNTMLPGAQHPSLNYNATESSHRANDWRSFAQSQPGYGGLDDDDDLPPPSSMASSGGDPKSISEQMRLLKERASQPIEERIPVLERIRGLLQHYMYTPARGNREGGLGGGGGGGKLGGLPFRAYMVTCSEKSGVPKPGLKRSLSRSSSSDN